MVINLVIIPINSIVNVMLDKEFKAYQAKKNIIPLV